MKRLISIALLVLTAALPLAARRQKTGPARLHKAPAPTERYDTIVPPASGAIRCSGYDKPNGATREMFFLSNLMPDSLDVDGVNVTFDYYDMKGRQLHSATHTLRVNLPAGQTRNVGVRSWDRNNAFHYFRSQAPQRRASTPYRVTSRVNYVLRLSRP